MLFSTLDTTKSLYLMGLPIECIHEKGATSSIKLVGVHLDKQRIWKQHINHVKVKVARAMSLICRAKHYLPNAVKVLLFKSLINCHLEYCITLWGGASASLLKPLVSMHKKALRVATGSPYNSHSELLFALLNTLKFEDIYTLRVASMAYIIIEKRALLGLASAFRVIEPQENLRSRQSATLFVPQLKRMP
jgi:hypothetical protein